MNLAVILGRLGQDPELKQIGSTQKVSLSVATGTKWKDKQTGEQKEKTDWHNVEAWGAQAEVINKYFKKGDQIAIQGEINYQSWDKEDGTKGYRTVIKMNSFNFVGNSQKVQVSDQQEFNEPKFDPPPALDTNDEVPF